MKWSGILLAAAAGVAAYSIYNLLQEDEGDEQAQGNKPDTEIPFEIFKKDFAVVDQVTGRCIAGWIRDQKWNEGMICFVAYPAKEMLDEFRITGCPEELDPESNLLQFIFDSRADQVTAARLISFGSVSDKVKELFCGKQYFILKDEQPNPAE